MTVWRCCTCLTLASENTSKSPYFCVWPGMTADIKAQISNCSACQKFQTKQPAETLRNELPTTQPWTCLATDIFEYGGKSYIIVVDRYSKFIVVVAKFQITAVSRQLLPSFRSLVNLVYRMKSIVTEEPTLPLDCSCLSVKVSMLNCHSAVHTTTVGILLKELCVSSKTL